MHLLSSNANLMKFHSSTLLIQMARFALFVSFCAESGQLAQEYKNYYTSDGPGIHIVPCTSYTLYTLYGIILITIAGGRGGPGTLGHIYILYIYILHIYQEREENGKAFCPAVRLPSEVLDSSLGYDKLLAGSLVNQALVETMPKM